MTHPNHPLTVQTRRWLSDDDDCAIVRFALPAVGIELSASLVALPLGHRTCYSLLLHYDNGRQFVEFVTPLSIRTATGVAADCAQSLQAVLGSKMFVEQMAAPMVAHMQANGMLAGGPQARP